MGRSSSVSMPCTFIYIFNSKIQVWKYSISTKISLMLPTPAPTIPAHGKQPCVLHFGSVGILLYEGNPPVVKCNVGFLFVFTRDNIPGIYPSIVYHNFMASLSLSRDPSYGNATVCLSSHLLRDVLGVPSLWRLQKIPK